MEQQTAPVEMISILQSLIPSALVLLLGGAGLMLAHWFLIRRQPNLGPEARLPRQLIMLVLSMLMLIALILAYPLTDSTRAQLIGLLGIVLTGVIGLSSTTFVSNAMAGFMLRAVGSFRPGDFIRVGDNVGRVTERGLFRTEIQTEDRDLVTLPNIHMVTNPVAVVRASGTIVSASLSLGYDADHATVEPLLKKAAESIGLVEPFVQVVDLGDFSVTYRAAGFLDEVKHLLTVRSELRRSILDTLHGAGIEIVSPSFMNQRPLAPDQLIIPRVSRRRGRMDSNAADQVFDKAEAAAELESLRAQQVALKEDITQIKQRVADADEAGRAALESDLARSQRDAEGLQAHIEAREAEIRQAE